MMYVIQNMRSLRLRSLGSSCDKEDTRWYPRTCISLAATDVRVHDKEGLHMSMQTVACVQRQRLTESSEHFADLTAAKMLSMLSQVGDTTNGSSPIALIVALW